MGLGTNHLTGRGGDMDVFMPEVWADRVSAFFRENLVAAPFFSDWSDALSGGGDQVNIPKTQALTANAFTVGSEVTLNGPTYVTVALVVDTRYECSFIIDKYIARQVNALYRIEEEFAKDAAHAVAKQYDTAILALIDGFSNSVGATTVAITDAIIRSALDTLETGNVNLNECAFFMSPSTFWTGVQAIDKFSLAQNATADPVMRMPQGYLYGLPVYRSNNLPLSGVDYSNVLAHPSAIAHATLGGVEVDTNYVPEYMGHLTTADVCYGVIENRDEAAVRILAT